MAPAGRLTFAFCGAALAAAVIALEAQSPARPPAASPDPFGVANVDCARIRELGIDRQMNLRAAAILQHCAGGAPPAASAAATDAAASAALADIGGSDINVVTGGETSPHVMQDGGAVWSHGDTVVVVYNDASGVALTPLSLCGASRSTDGGATFTREAYKFNVGTSCYGEPSVFYSVHANKWFAVMLADVCNGSGVNQWESPDGAAWTDAGCVASTSGADSPYSWVDNNAGSPYYGRQYVVYNDFNVGGGAVLLKYSIDDGGTWSTPVTVNAAFRRAVQMTGSLGADGTVYVEMLEENGGGLGNRTHSVARSVNGGANWTVLAQTGAVYGPGRATCGYFAAMYTAPSPGYWREMGWGQMGVGSGGVLHYAYSSGDPGTTDPGNIFYTRSTDNGTSWSVPVKLNTDATILAQWGVGLTVTPQGRVFVSWYDERHKGASDELERYGRASNNQGLTWQADGAVSDVVFPKPLQQDPNIVPCWVGITHHARLSHDGRGTTSFQPWTDGRVLINAASQQDVFLDRVNAAPVPVEFDLDGKSDIGVFRPSSGTWYLNRSQAGFFGMAFGLSTDRIVPGDYDGDARTDIAVYRNGTWYLQRSTLGFTGMVFGLSNDIPMPGDFDGDGRTDLAVFRPSSGTWYLQQSSLGFTGVPFGLAGDKPVHADFDGDGRSDVAVFRPSNGTWYWLASSTGAFHALPFGQNGDLPMAGDYNGDGRTDIAVFRSSLGNWYESISGTGQFVSAHWGLNGDIPASGDFDGDGRDDLAVFRGGTWYVQGSKAGLIVTPFGLNGDLPLQAAHLQ